MNKNAQALGRLNKGVPKHYSEEEIRIRTLRLAEAREKRWASKKVISNECDKHKNLC